MLFISYLHRLFPSTTVGFRLLRRSLFSGSLLFLSPSKNLNRHPQKSQLVWIHSLIKKNTSLLYQNALQKLLLRDQSGAWTHCSVYILEAFVCSHCSPVLDWTVSCPSMKRCKRGLFSFLCQSCLSRSPWRYWTYSPIHPLRNSYWVFSLQPLRHIEPPKPRWHVLSTHDKLLAFSKIKSEVFRKSPTMVRKSPLPLAVNQHSTSFPNGYWEYRSSRRSQRFSLPSSGPVYVLTYYGSET